MKSGPTVTVLGDTVVLDEDLQPVEPGSGVIGKIARFGDIPVGYYNDPVKTAEVFITVDGARYVMPGDFATVEADGIGHPARTRLGGHQLGRREDLPRGGRVGGPLAPRRAATPSWSAPPTSAGARRSPPSSSPGGQHGPDLEDDPGALPGRTIAGYKVPRRLYTVERIERSPAGKPDYRWADDRSSTPRPTPA